MSQLKEKLYLQCLDYVQKRMEAAEQGIKEAQQASKDDTKSSAGDKYETGRAMMQQETDRNRQQLNETNKLKVILNQVNPSAISEKIDTGSLVITDNGNFYIAISAGTLMVDNEAYFAVSPRSPIGLLLKGKKTGGKIVLNGKPYHIKMVI
ncbi:MAG: 3-oxoacyl-ACP synthase [Mucilaginibacter sp.]|nr:3-oxoacyl-ACP synthase [Mucilaginibacter sp.]